MSVDLFDSFVIRTRQEIKHLFCHLSRHWWSHSATNASLLRAIRIPPEDMMAINFSHNPVESDMISHREKTIWPALMSSACGINPRYSHGCAR